MEFRGRIGRDWRDSTPWWPERRRPPAGAPNVVLVVLDDVGFAQLGCYGSDLETPTFDALAAAGVRLTNFHTTALCSPTRACLLTGRNHHRNGLGRVADLAVGFPGYSGQIPPENGMLSEVLSSAGYATLAVGKWHLSPESETNAAGDRSTWPLRRGFDRWYGFHGGETHQFHPALFCDSHPVGRPAPAGEDYHLSTDLADHAIEYLGDLRAVDPSQPFFLYLAFGACHSPHQPPARWLEAYRGRFDEGWDAWREATFARQRAHGLVPPHSRLSPRPAWVPAWADLDTDQRRVAARMMEAFAGFLSHADEQLERVLAFIADLGETERTLVVVVSDNGASAEGGADGSINDVRLANLDPASPREMRARLDEIGGPLTHNNYPWGWTMAGNTPFRRWKREVHEGGVADPCIVTWPGGPLEPGALRTQFAHVIDVAPTILELAAVPWPARLAGREQSTVDGISFAYLLGPDGATAPERHDTQYFEMFGSRALYHRGWKAVTFHPIGPLYDDQPVNAPFDDDVWELYRIDEDPGETTDLATAHPDVVADLVARWWREAERNQVLPLDNRVLWALVHPPPDGRPARDTYRYFPHGAPVPERVAAPVCQRSHDLVVDVDVPSGGADGTLVALGSALGGWSLHVLGGYVRYVHNLYGARIEGVTASRPLGPGAHHVVLEFVKDAGLGGVATLLVDGEISARGRIERFTPSAFTGLGVGLTCGYEWGPAVGPGYRAPFTYRGLITRAEIRVRGPVVRDPLAEIEAILSRE